MGTVGTQRAGRRNGGYTLMELVTVICIIGIVGSLFAPVWTDYITRLKIRSTSNRVVGDLAFARMWAVRSGHTTSLILEPSSDCAIRFRGKVTGHRYRIVSRADPGVPLRRVDLRQEGGRACLEMGGVDSVSFNSRGLPHRFHNRTFWVHERAAADSMTLSVVGRILRRY